MKTLTSKSEFTVGAAVGLGRSAIKNSVATSNKKLIRAYCEKHGVFVPAGFDRHSASRYVIIRRDVSPPKLIAKTWFNQKDVVYHVEGILKDEVDSDINEAIEILDFKDAQRFRYRAPGRLEADGAFTLCDA